MRKRKMAPVQREKKTILPAQLQLGVTSAVIDCPEHGRGMLTYDVCHHALRPKYIPKDRRAELARMATADRPGLLLCKRCVIEPHGDAENICFAHAVDMGLLVDPAGEDEKIYYAEFIARRSAA